MSWGTEFERSHGLDWISGTTKKLVPESGLPVPHIGWTEVYSDKDSELFKNINNGSTFYFVHSFYVEPDETSNILATFRYGDEYCAALRNDNILGVQFHPEKSQENGLQLLRNFAEMEN